MDSPDSVSLIEDKHLESIGNTTLDTQENDLVHDLPCYTTQNDSPHYEPTAAQKPAA